MSKRRKVTVLNHEDDNFVKGYGQGFRDGYYHGYYGDYISETESESYNSDEEYEMEIIEIKKEIRTIDDLIELGNMYDPKAKGKKRKKYNINLEVLHKLIGPLTKLKNMIGMSSVKKTIVGHIIYLMQDLEDGNSNMLHTVIEGPPGVGKTELGKILGKIYLAMGILNKDVFKVAKRSDLVAKYLGQTAIKTQKFIDSCLGGVMFIDEAYSLGNPEQRDSFAKECIDTINQNLTENKKNFLCIIAGYPKELKKCFFAYNPGLERRFTFRYAIEAYQPRELRYIFIKMVKDINWQVDDKEIPLKFFEDNMKHFPHFGGSMEDLLFKCKLEHGRRIFGMPPENRKKITYQDIESGFREFMHGKEKKEDDTSYKMMYL